MMENLKHNKPQKTFVEVNNKPVENKYSKQYFEYEYDDEDCPEDKFWHIRGKRCVPLKCYKRRRDYDTGECKKKSKKYSNNIEENREWWGKYGGKNAERFNWWINYN